MLYEYSITVNYESCLLLSAVVPGSSSSAAAAAFLPGSTAASLSDGVVCVSGGAAGAL